MTRYTAKITNIEGKPTQRIRLQVPEDYSFDAGQYLSVHGPDDVEIPLSIASCPTLLPRLELHYRSTPGLAQSQAMDQALTQESLTISDAQGDVRCAPANIKQLIIAGGTGAAQAFSCAIARCANEATASTDIAWCVDRPEDLYDVDILSQLPNTTVHTLIDEARTPQNEGLEWVRTRADGYRDARVILAGSPAFIYLVTDILLACGFREQQLQADAYSYAPRSE